MSSMKSLKHELFHVYLDEGGAVGHPTLHLTKTHELIPTSETHVANWYYGKMTPMGINSFIRLFNRAWPNTPITKIKGSTELVGRFNNALSGEYWGM